MWFVKYFDDITCRKWIIKVQINCIYKLSNIYNVYSVVETGEDFQSFYILMYQC